MRSKSIATGALAVVAALASAGAASADVRTAVESVKAHTDRADAGLDRAVALFERNADRRGARKLASSRRELGRAAAKAARLRRQADTSAERGRAARAAALVADQRGENVGRLVGVLGEVGGRVQGKVARAALADTRGRDKAIAVISALLEQGTSERAAEGLAKALGALVRDRGDEVELGMEALRDDRLASSTRRTVARTLKANVDGQETAARRLAELIADEDMPAQSRPGLQRALEQMAGARPEPPAGQPEGVPRGRPEGVPAR